MSLQEIQDKINDYIKQNGKQEITAVQSNEVLQGILDFSSNSRRIITDSDIPESIARDSEVEATINAIDLTWDGNISKIGLFNGNTIVLNDFARNSGEQLRVAPNETKSNAKHTIKTDGGNTLLLLDELGQQKVLVDDDGVLSALRVLIGVLSTTNMREVAYIEYKSDRETHPQILIQPEDLGNGTKSGEVIKVRGNLGGSFTDNVYALLTLENTNPYASVGARINKTYLFRAFGGHIGRIADFTIHGDGVVSIGYDNKVNSEKTTAALLGCYFRHTNWNGSHTSYLFENSAIGHSGFIIEKKVMHVKSH